MKNLRYIFILGLIIAVFSSCYSSKTSLQSSNFNYQSNPNVSTNIFVLDDSINVFSTIDAIEVTIPEINERPIKEETNEISLADEIVLLAKDFLGIRYRAGGTTSVGMDCSGMVYATFQKKDMTVPRSSGALAVYGIKIKKREAMPGDLIFFKTSKRKVINHVGIITEVADDDIKFIHASVHAGVIISSLSEPYYTRTYAKINRVLE